MKKALALLLLIGAVCMAQQPLKNGTSKSYRAEINTDPATNYYGWASVNKDSVGTANTNSLKWYIVKEVTDSNGNPIDVRHAYGSGEDDNSLWSTAWTNRASATYK